LSKLVPTVLLAAPDSATTDEWRRALLGMEVRILEAPRGLESTAGQRIDIAIGRWDRATADALRALHPAARLVHCEPELPVALVEAIGHGIQVEYAAGAEDLRQVVLRLARPRRLAARLAIAGLTVKIQGRGQHQLLDLSSAGLAFVLGHNADVGAFLPGEAITGLSVWREERLLLDGAEARIIRLTPQADSYHVGCALRAPTPGNAVLRVIRDPATCVGLVHSAVRSRQLVLRRIPSDGQELQPLRARLDVATRSLELAGLDQVFSLFEVIECQFELAGTLYRFRAACASVAPLKLRLPAGIEVLQQRGAPRHPASSELRIVLESPFGGGTIERRVGDVSTSGLSFDIDAARDLLPVGTRIHKLTLKRGDAGIPLRGHVRNLVDRQQALRCGVELDHLDHATREHLVELLMHDRYPSLDPSGVDFDGLLAFMRKAGYLDEKREQALEPLYPDARRIHAALRKDSQGLQRTFVVREAGKLVGHIAGLRAYPRTWMFHHLAALPGHRAAGVLSVAVVDELLHEGSCEFFRLWFLNSARFPSRVFGGFARKLANGPLSDIRAYAHAVLPVAHWANDRSDLDVGDADATELLQVEQHLVATLPSIVVQAEDLTRQGLHLASLDQRYLQRGAYRHRRVLAVRREARMLGYALLEISSPGLNLADALSSFRVVIFPDAPAAATQEARRALVGKAVAIYGRSGRELARCLIAPEEAAEYTALGMKLDEDTSLCWTCHRSQFQAFAEHMRVFFEELVARGRPKERAADAA
jgi:PilZ domain